MSGLADILRCRSRFLVDCHISDEADGALAAYDPLRYAEMMALGGAESSMIYACDHNGNCYYPTKHGHVHRGIGTRDIFGETVDAVAKRGIVPVAYYTLIYHNDAAKSIPEAHCEDIHGRDHSGRYHFVCPNHPDTVHFHQEQVREILQYPVAGIFLDMTFWPMICCCEACRGKFRKATGLEIPEVMDWRDPAWVAFQRFRERSMADFARKMTDFVHSIRPEAAVVHQFSPVLHGWLLGQSTGIALASSYTSGDFYGDRNHQRFAVKVMNEYSQAKPYEFMTSRCVSLVDHTSTKSDDELFFCALTTLANGGAYFFIDAINPDGTLEERFYRRLHGIQERLAPFRKCAEEWEPVLSGNVGVYFSMTSCVDPRWNGVRLSDFNENDANNMSVRKNPCVDEALELSKMLTRKRRFWRVATESTTDFAGLDTIFLGNGAYLSLAEQQRLREFVDKGGTLVVTENTSLYDENGASSGDFGLADVMGVHYQKHEGNAVNYTETPGGLIYVFSPATLALPAADTEVRGGLWEPLYPARDPDHYASIHSDPPGKKTPYVGWSVHPYGKGRCVYIASGVWLYSQASQEGFLGAIIEEFTTTPLKAAKNLHSSTEVILLDTREPKTKILAVVNAQPELPPVPLHEVELALALEGVSRVTRASDGAELPVVQDADGRLVITAPMIDAGEFWVLQ